MKLIPHHQHDKNGRREYRSPDETWRVVRTRRPGGNRNERPRWEVHERHEDHADWHCHHAAFERRRDALVFLDTTAATPGGESTAVTTMAPKQRETPERSAEPPPPSPRRPPRRPISRRPTGCVEGASGRPSRTTCPFVLLSAKAGVASRHDQGLRGVPVAAGPDGDRPWCQPAAAA